MQRNNAAPAVHRAPRQNKTVGCIRNQRRWGVPGGHDIAVATSIRAEQWWRQGSSGSVTDVDGDGEGQGQGEFGDITIYFLDYLWPRSRKNEPRFSNLRPYRNIISARISKNNLETRLFVHFLSRVRSYKHILK